MRVDRPSSRIRSEGTPSSSASLLRRAALRRSQMICERSESTSLPRGGSPTSRWLAHHRMVKKKTYRRCEREMDRRVRTGRGATAPCPSRGRGLAQPSPCVPDRARPPRRSGSPGGIRPASSYASRTGTLRERRATLRRETPISAAVACGQMVSLVPWGSGRSCSWRQVTASAAWTPVSSILHEVESVLVAGLAQSAHDPGVELANSRF